MSHNPACFAAHMGLWLIHDAWFWRALSAIEAGLVPQLREGRPDNSIEFGFDPRGELLEDGTAVIPITGPMTKAGSAKFGESSTLTTRRAIRNAARDNDVERIMLYIDSPGGHFAGTNELAQDFRDAGQIKPTMAHIEDMGASAAYYVGSQAHLININPTGETGSIGTIGAVMDRSKEYEMMGRKVHVFSTGPYKGMGVPGTQVTKEMAAIWQSEVDRANGFFLDAVTAGRDGIMSRKQVEAVADGRTYGADEALNLGLVDQVSFFDDFLEEASSYAMG